MKKPLIRCILGLSLLASAGCPARDSASEESAASEERAAKTALVAFAVAMYYFA